jgi:hypothetical protein
MMAHVKLANMGKLRVAYTGKFKPKYTQKVVHSLTITRGDNKPGLISCQGWPHFALRWIFVRTMEMSPVLFNAGISK